MKYRRWNIILAAAALLLGLVTATPAARADETEWVYGDDYQAGDYGRVRHHEGGLTIRRAAPGPDGPATVDGGANVPVYPGDTVLTQRDQRAEIQLAGGTLVRLDRNSDLTFLALPDPYADFIDNTVLQLAEGLGQISAFLGENEEFRIDTPAATVYLLGDGDFRIEVASQGRTRVISRRGVAEVVGNEGSVIVRGGMFVEVFPGALPSTPEPFNTFTSDGFDRWVNERDAIFQANDRYADPSGYSNEVYEELPNEVRPYYRELSHQGRWVYTSDFGHVWYPVGVASGWRPYWDGYWDYGPGGYFWVSHEPWGWAPYHYGRWSWVSSYGWCWIPGRVFAGAWVAWSWGSAHVGWAPLSYWNLPVYYGTRYYGYYDPHCWTFVNYNHIHHRHYRRYAVPTHTVIHSARHNAIVTRPPRVSPRQLARSQEWRDRARRSTIDESRARIRSGALDRDATRRSFRDTDARLVRTVGDARKRERETLDRARVGSTARGRDGTGTRGGVTATPGRGLPAYPRRITTEPRRGGSRPTATSPARPSAPRTGVRTRSTTDTGSRRMTPGTTDDRVRDLYRRMSGPRTTRERSTTGSSAGDSRSDRAAPGRGSSSSGSRAQPKSRSGSSGSRAKPRSRSGSGDKRSATQPSSRATSDRRNASVRSTAPTRTRVSQPRVNPSRSYGSRSKPTVRSSSPSRSAAPRSTARPSRSSGSRSKPTARPSRSTGSRSKPTVRSGGSSRSSSSKSGARSSRGSSGRSGSSAGRSGSSRSGGGKSSSRSSSGRGGGRGRK